MSVVGHREDMISGEEAVTLHEGFVRQQAMRWKLMLPHLDLDDLLQEGRIALVMAQRTFDPGRGVVFLTYAGRAVQVRMKNFVHRAAHTIRMPRHRLFEAPGMVSLDVTVFDDTHETLHALVADEGESGWEQDDRHVKLHRAITRLREVERHVVMECLVRGRIQREVAVEMQCSHTWVQQLLDKAMKSLRRAMGVAMPKDPDLMGWVPMKQWLADEGRRLNVSPQAVRVQMYRGTRPMPEIKRVKGRYFVRVNAETMQDQNSKLKGEHNQ